MKAIFLIRPTEVYKEIYIKGKLIITSIRS